jgi:hypothetical protein
MARQEKSRVEADLMRRRARQLPAYRQAQPLLAVRFSLHEKFKGRSR